MPKSNATVNNPELTAVAEFVNQLPCCAADRGVVKRELQIVGAVSRGDSVIEPPLISEGRALRRPGIGSEEKAACGQDQREQYGGIFHSFVGRESPS